MRLLRGEIEALCLENETQRRKNEALCLENETQRRKNEALCLENETQRRKNEALCLDNDHLRREIETLRSRQPAAVGPMYAPLNYALRTENISDWATTIGCCYSGVLKLSFLSQPARVYRGVKEDEMQLPEEFLSREEGKFAGGVERAFMSTTKSAAVALDYSGGGAASGSIFVIDFDMNSRGASIQFLSQYPHEAELLFPPCTGLGCLDVSEHGRKRCVLVSAQVSTARLDTREVATPTHVPGTAAALQWAAEVLFDNCSVEEVVGKEEWNLQHRNLSHDEHAERLALLLGRASTVAAPRARVVDLQESQLSPVGGAAIGKALKVNAVLTKLNLDGHELDLPKLRGTDPVASLDLSRKGFDLGPASAIVIASLIAGNGVLKSIDLKSNKIGPEGGIAIGKALAVNAVLKNLDVRRNEISGDAAQPLATAVLASTSLEIFGSVPLKELRANTLDKLDLSRNGFGVPEALVLAKLVEGSEGQTTGIGFLHSPSLQRAPLQPTRARSRV